MADTGDDVQHLVTKGLSPVGGAVENNFSPLLMLRKWTDEESHAKRPSCQPSRRGILKDDFTSFREFPRRRGG